MKLDMELLTLETRHTFTISRGARKKYRNFIFRLTWEGFTGIGECAPQVYYGEDEASVLEAVRRVEGKLDGDPETLKDRLFAGDLKALLERDNSVRAGLDMALWDIIGRREHKPCHALFSLDPRKTPYTSYTIGFDSPEVVRMKLTEAQPYRILKIKMGLPGDLEILDEIRKQTDKTIRVDANEGWNLATALRLAEELERKGIEFIEQPISHFRKEELKALKRSSGIPIILDESIVHPGDVDDCRDQGHGINIKLMKCGGITPAREMIGRAKRHGLKVMLGCMIETSVGITAAAHLSPDADYADLDGNLLLSRDPFIGVRVDDGKLVLPGGSGLGVTPRE
ncbi:MAG: dipeptide epimerase [Chitinivibrionia bacterium]|nr:dipeptide epimerase [Chitinivibrionia bacterium]